MRYSLTTLACAALAATTLAAPVIDKRARDVLIFTDYTTIIVTKTITTGEPQATAAEVQAEWVNGGHAGRKSSTYGAPVYTTRTTTLEPITIGTSTTTLSVITTTLEPVASTPAVEVPGTTTVVQEVTSSPEPVTVITTIQDETAAAPTTAAPVETTSTSVAPVPTTTAAATTTSTAATPADTWAADVLNAHNTRRALHGAPALTWNTTMASYAAGVSKGCVFEHSGGPYGENLAAGYTTDEAIEAWYAEGASYDYAAGLFSEATGHFTQLVWASATQVGCGIATCGTSTTPGDMLTCEYDTGNVIGYFVANVLPLV
ncbi:uncharacterized protein H6S33_011329 [Morchella sextelata]|uniref:uncharacterized protein n=1 Tax=Morchella sextelata TaxID=1174677 RepID=UPI001D04F71D|nr:uncharacterized protein H6S33_011329 [Morchella sextelata]KAH0610902.1 hypothetical protein H6S33_011329 [Morchella sextelata]